MLNPWIAPSNTGVCHPTEALAELLLGKYTLFLSACCLLCLLMEVAAPSASPQVFSFKDWRRHRSNSRFLHHILTLRDSGVIRNVARPVLTVAAMALGKWTKAFADEWIAGMKDNKEGTGGGGEKASRKVRKAQIALVLTSARILLQKCLAVRISSQPDTRAPALLACIASAVVCGFVSYDMVLSSRGKLRYVANEVTCICSQTASTYCHAA